MEPTVKDDKVSGYRRKTEIQFYNSFKAFIWLNQVFCAAPFCSDLFTSPKALKRVHEKFCSVLHLLFGFAVCACVCFATYEQSKNHDESMGFLTQILYIAEYIIGTFNLLLVIVGCQYQKKFYAVFFKRLVNVDINLQKCGIQPNYITTKVYLIRSTVVYFVFFISVIIVDFMYNSMHAESFVVSSTVYTIPNIVSTLALTQYATVLHFIRDKLRTINAILRRLVINSNSKDNQNRLTIISVLAMDGGRINNLTRVLDILRKQHAELSRLMELLNDCFGLLIILIIIASYIILSTQFYAFYKISEGFEPVDVYLTIYTTLWVILHSGKVLLVLYPINDVCDERKRSGNILFEMDLAENDSKYIRTFADQLIHENSPPHAMRIVNLDLTIAGTMVGVLTTYLIILIQFDASARDQPNDCVKLTNPIYKNTTSE